MNGLLWTAVGCLVAGPVLGIPAAKLGSPLNVCVALWLVAVVLAMAGFLVRVS